MEVDFTDIALAAGATRSFRLYFTDSGAGFGDPDAVTLDNVRLLAVPEPATAVLAGAGALVLLGRRRA